MSRSNSIMGRKTNEGDPQRGDTQPDRNFRLALAQVEQSLKGLQFGQVTVIVQDGIVMQIDRLERTRLHRKVE